MEAYARHPAVRHVSECSLESPACGCVGLVEIVRAPCPSKTVEELRPGYLRVRELQAPRGRNCAEIGAIMDGQLGLYYGSETIGAGVPVCRFVAERIVKEKPQAFSNFEMHAEACSFLRWKSCKRVTFFIPNSALYKRCCDSTALVVWSPAERLYSGQTSKMHFHPIPPRAIDIVGLHERDRRPCGVGLGFRVCTPDL